MLVRYIEASVQLAARHPSVIRQLKSSLLLNRSLATAAAGQPKKWQSHYEVLRVKKDASQADIKAAFLNLSKEVHPDLNPGDSSRHDKFVELNEAYNVLSKLQSRREYDYTLAAMIHYQKSAANLYRSYAAGESHAPGASTTGAYRSNAQEEFWDETIWSMRDKAAWQARPDEYYGIKGIRKLPKYFIVLGCMVFMGFGVILHMVAFKWSKTYNNEILQEQNRANSAFLSETRRRARENGNELQLKLLEAATYESVRAAAAAAAASQTTPKAKVSTTVSQTPS